MATTPLNKQFVVYFDESTMQRVKSFARKRGMSMNQLIREGVEQRMANDKPYASGYNDAVKKAMIVVKENNVTKMRFPSGKSFAELINEDLEGLLKDEVTGEE